MTGNGTEPAAAFVGIRKSTNKCVPSSLTRRFAAPNAAGGSRRALARFVPEIRSRTGFSEWAGHQLGGSMRETLGAEATALAVTSATNAVNGRECRNRLVRVVPKTACRLGEE